MSASLAPAPQRRRLPLATRMFLLIAALLILAIGSAVMVSLRLGTRIADQAVNHALQSSAAVQSEFAAKRLEEVELKVQLIAADAAFVNYVNDAQAGAGTGDPLLTENASIYDLLLERRDSYGFDLGMVLDYQGAVLARTDQPEAFEQSLAEDPLVASSLETLTPISGYWRMGDRVYLSAIWPLDQNQNLVGFLLVAKAVDDELGRQIRDISDADVAFVLPVADRVELIGTSLGDDMRRALLGELQANQGGLSEALRGGHSIEQAELSLNGSRWVGQLHPLSEDGDPSVGGVLRLSSRDQAEAGYRDLLNTIALVGIAVLLVALPLSLLLARTSLQPLREMSRIAKDAVAGKYQSSLALAGKDELAELSQAFDSLLSDLRGERDIESYITHLSRLLPEPGDEPMGTEADRSPPGLALPAARHGPWLLVAAELRGKSAATAGSPSQQVAAAAELGAGVLALAEEAQGELLQFGGSRWVIGFAPALGHPPMLHFAREFLASDASAALAVLPGELTTGALQLTPWTAPVALGTALSQLEKLLAEAPVGHLLLPKPLGEEIKQRLGEDKVGIAKGQLSARPYYAMSAPHLAALPETLIEAKLKVSAATPGSADHPTMLGSAAAGRDNTNDLPPGSRLGERFRVISVLGTGGMGVVYKARDLDLDDIVALKMLKGEALGDHEQLDRLKSEIKLARRITHPNVLRTFDFGEIEGRPFISMEYVRGLTLRYLIKQSGRIPFTAALRIARQLCAGLQAAHEVGVLHRDIKPENLILEASGNAKLMDFGIARPIRRVTAGNTEPGMYVGTPAYSAPEQLAAQDVDHRADIFATGVLMSEMFSGQLPFSGSSTVEIYMAQMQSEPLRPSAAWPEIPAALEAIILRCIQRRAEDRFQSVAELCLALAEVRA